MYKITTNWVMKFSSLHNLKHTCSISVIGLCLELLIIKENINLISKNWEQQFSLCDWWMIFELNISERSVCKCHRENYNLNHFFITFLRLLTCLCFWNGSCHVSSTWDHFFRVVSTGEVSWWYSVVKVYYYFNLSYILYFIVQLLYINISSFSCEMWILDCIYM